MSARDELATVIVEAYGEDSGACPCEQDLDVAAHILSAGYRKPKVIGYIVVDRGGILVGKQFKHREAAQAFADESTADCETAGIDWDYRVAEIVEAGA